MSDEPEKKKEQGDDGRAGAERALALLGIAVLAYLLGALSAAHGAWPYPTVAKGFQALQAFVHKASLGSLATKYDSTLWRTARFEGKGVVKNERGRAVEGYTLLTSGHRQGAALVDMDGDVVHEWALPFREIWDSPPHVAEPIPSGFIHWARVWPFANGDLLAVVVATDDSPQGYGLIKIDRDSNLLWAYAANAHHDLHVESDGTILALVSEVRDLGERPLPNSLMGDTVVMDEFVVTLSPDGEELERASLLEAVAGSKYARALGWHGGELWDPLHPNNVEPAGAAFARHHAGIEPHDLIVSMRNVDMLVAFDPTDKTIDWAARGAWRQQHDPDPLPDGSLLVYDNLGSLDSAGASQILKYDPATNATRRLYSGSDDAPFHSEIRGTQQLLENGNLLISDCENGRIIEVDTAGTVVWEYRNPERETVESEELVAIIQSATRLPKSSLDFL